MKRINRSTIGILAAVSALVIPILPAKADPIFVRAQPNAQLITIPNVWTTVAGTAINISVTQQKPVIARFTAESTCYGVSGYCPVRIVYRRTDIPGPITEFNPIVGTDFAFDSTDNGTESSSSWESHAVNRSVFLPFGRYEVFVQAYVFPGISLRLDDAHFEVEL